MTSRNQEDEEAYVKAEIQGLQDEARETGWHFRRNDSARRCPLSNMPATLNVIDDIDGNGLAHCPHCGDEIFLTVDAKIMVHWLALP